MCTVFVVAEHFKQSRNMNCLNLVTTAFWATLFDRPCSVFSEYIMTAAVKELCYKALKQIRFLICFKKLDTLTPNGGVSYQT